MSDEVPYSSEAYQLYVCEIRVEKLERELAATQAREKVLRDVLKWIQARSAKNHIVDEALAVPTDDTTLP